MSRRIRIRRAHGVLHRLKPALETSVLSARARADIEPNEGGVGRIDIEYHTVISFIIVLIYNYLIPSSGNEARNRFLVGIIVGVFIDIDHFVVASFRTPHELKSAILTFKFNTIIEAIKEGSKWMYRSWHPMWIGLVFGSAPLYLSGNLITVLRLVLIFHFAADYYLNKPFDPSLYTWFSLGWLVSFLIVRFARITA